MARKTVRVDVPRRSPDEMLVLINTINLKNVALGQSTPLDAEDSAALVDIYNKALAERQQAKTLEAQAQAHNQNARQFLGMNKEQSVHSPGTGLFHVTQVRDTLLKKFKGKEEQLGEWGFPTVVGNAKSPRPRQKKS